MSVRCAGRGVGNVVPLPSVRERKPRPMRRPRSGRNPSGSPRSVVLQLPGQAEFISVARLVAVAVAGRTPLDLDELEDLKLAVGEACTMAIRSGTEAIGLVFTVHPDRLEVHVAYRIAPHLPGTPDPLGLFLIQCVTDEFRVATDGADRTLSFTRRFRRP